MAKIIYGICGIGLGHVSRQRPIIDALLAQGPQIFFCAYAQSLMVLRERLEGKPSVSIQEVSVPFIPAGPNGLDFERSASLNQGLFGDSERLNALALAKAQSWLGKPDLCISDYEPICARYAYAHGVQVVTIDQQSKFLACPFDPIGGLNCEDEIQRLRLFFPKAHRIAASFFNPLAFAGAPRYGFKAEEVEAVGPILSERARAMKPIPEAGFFCAYLTPHPGA